MTNTTRRLALPVLGAVLAAATFMQGAYHLTQLAPIAGIAGAAAIALREPRLPRRALLAFAVLAAALLASAAANGFPDDAWKPALTLVLGAAVFTLASRASREDGAPVVADAVVAVASIAALLGIVGVLFHVREWALPSEDVWRLSSTLTYQNAAAALFAMALPHALVRRDAVHRVVAAVLPVALLLTQSRGGIVAAAVALGVLAITKAVPAKALAAAAAAGVVAVVAVVALTPLGDRLGSSNQRIETWRASVERAGDAPLFGTGPGTYRIDLPRADGRPGVVAHAHSEYVQTLVETGVVGLAAVIAAIALLASGRPAPAGLASGAAFLVHSAFDFLWRVPLLVAVALALHAASQRSRR